MISLLCSFFDNIINSIREIPPVTQVVIQVLMLALMVTCIAFGINKGKKHDEKPIKWRFIILAIILFVMLILFSVIT